MDVNSFVIGYNKGKASGGGMKGFHKVQFFNDDRTTLLYTVFVPDGADVIYAGETPISMEDATLVFKGFEPIPTNITADLDTYAVYDAIGTLDQTTWARIAATSADGTAQNYFAVGDTKMVHIEGTVGTTEVNGDYGVYILGFDHNEEVEGAGIHFGTFKKTDGTDIAMVSADPAITATDGRKTFNVNHWGSYNYGGWAGCDLRYDILGSTDKAPSGYGGAPASNRTGTDPSETCATKPKANTLMAALPSDLRAVMKPMKKSSNNKGGAQSSSNYTWTFSNDYLPLLERVEITGSGDAKTNLKQYDYFATGHSVIKYEDSENGAACMWLTRTAATSGPDSFYVISATGANNTISAASYKRGIAPIFKV